MWAGVTRKRWDREVSISQLRRVWLIWGATPDPPHIYVPAARHGCPAHPQGVHPFFAVTPDGRRL
jgi:hypothetical protein